MKTLRIHAKTRDHDTAVQRMNDRQEYMKTVDSNIHGGASPILYHSMVKPKVTVFPDWWTDADLRNYADRMSLIVLELEDEQHDSIIAQLDRRSLIDTTTPR